MRPRRTGGVGLVLRARARRRALQAVYAWQVSGGPISRQIEQFAHEQAKEIADLAYFEDLLTGLEKNLGEIDDALREYIDRDIDQVDPIERGVLRLAAYELLHRPDVPYRVVLNEAVETAKRFGAEHGHTYINGVLDKASVTWRAAEVGARR
jgi:transcription antitermination protein NusB